MTNMISRVLKNLRHDLDWRHVRTLTYGEEVVNLGESSAASLDRGLLHSFHSGGLSFLVLTDFLRLLRFLRYSNCTLEQVFSSSSLMWQETVVILRSSSHLANKYFFELHFGLRILGLYWSLQLLGHTPPTLLLPLWYQCVLVSLRVELQQPARFDLEGHSQLVGFIYWIQC